MGTYTLSLRELRAPGSEWESRQLLGRAACFVPRPEPGARSPELRRSRIGARPASRRTVLYLRVSSQAQRPDLRHQRAPLQAFCAAKGIAVDAWMEAIGGRLNFRRPKFLKLLDDIGAGRVKCLVIAHKDRLARFGFDLLHHMGDKHGCEVVVMNNETLSPEREMVEDLMAITHGFSARLYGLRNDRIGQVNMAEPLRFAGKIISGRVTERGGHWYLTVVVEVEEEKQAPPPHSAGIDFGLSRFATLSDGEVVETQAYLRKSEAKLKHLQRGLCRKQKGSKNWKKWKRRVTRFH